MDVVDPGMGLWIAVSDHADWCVGDTKDTVGCEDRWERDMALQTEIAGLTILLPIDEEPPDILPIAPRLDTFDGKAVVFLSNTKDNVNHLFAAMQAQLEAQYRPRDVVHRAKEHFAANAAGDLLADLHRACDAVITAAGA